MVSKGLGSGTAFSAFVGAAELRTLPSELGLPGASLQGSRGCVKGLGAEHGIQPLTAYIPPMKSEHLP